MAQIPYNPTPTVATQANPTPYDQTNPTAADFGGAVAEGVQQLGQKGGQIVQQQFQQALELQRQRNASLFNETDTAMSDEVSALTTEFQSVLGNNAADRLPEFQKRMEGIRDKYKKSLKVPELERAFSERWGQYQNTANRVFGSHAAQQVGDAFVKSLQSKSEAAVDRLIRNSGFGNTAPEYDEIIDSAVELADYMGWDKPVADGYVQRQASAAVQGIIQARVDNQQYQAAKSIFEQAKAANVPGTDVPMLDGQTAARLNHMITSEMKQAENLRRVELSQEAGELAQSSIKARMSTGQTLSPEDEAKIRAGFTDKQWEKYQSSVKTADEIYKRVGDIGTKSETEILASIEELRPKQSTTGYADPDFFRQQEVYDAAKGMAKQAIDQRNSDPAQAVVKGFTPVQHALNGLLKNPDDPGHAQSFVKKSLAAQQSIGMPAANQKPLPKVLADKIAGDIANPNPQAASIAIKKYADQFGPYWDKVFRQVSPKMDPATYAAATMDDEIAASVLINASRRPKEELLKLNNIKAPELTEVVVSHGVFQDFMNALRPLGDMETTARVRQAVETLSLGYMTTEGLDSAAAIEKSFKSVLGQYKFPSVNNQVFMAPKEVDADAAEAAGRRLLFKLSKDISAYEIPPAEEFRGMEPSEQKRLFANSIRDKGRWVTTPDMKGVRLYADRFPVYRYGEPVVLTWDQLLSGGKIPDSKDTQEVLRSRTPGVN
jgi:hypothetical protein